MFRNFPPDSISFPSLIALKLHIEVFGKYFVSDCSTHLVLLVRGWRTSGSLVNEVH